MKPSIQILLAALASCTLWLCAPAVVRADPAELAAIKSTLQHYRFVGWKEVANILYVGYQDSGGAWYIQKIDHTNGDVTYARGDANMPLKTQWESQSYAAFHAKF